MKAAVAITLMNSALVAAPITATRSLAVIQKIAQLQGNAWQRAHVLQGGGAITDYESRKAERYGQAFLGAG